MKQKYILTNIDKTVQKVMDDNGQLHWLSTGESLVLTNPPAESYIFHIEELLPEEISKKQLLDIIETYVANRKVLTNKEWKELGKYGFDKEARELYNLLETYTTNKKVLSKAEFEKLKGGIELNNGG
jgi:Lhr-like helicase